MEKKKFTDEKIMEMVKTFEDAQQLTGRPDTPEFADVPEDMREFFKGIYRTVVRNEALNQGWKPDYNDSSQKKWIPWFRGVSSGGFVFYATGYYCSAADAGGASRLCFRTEALARHSGETGIDDWNAILEK